MASVLKHLARSLLLDFDVKERANHARLTFTETESFCDVTRKQANGGKD